MMLAPMFAFVILILVVFVYGITLRMNAARSGEVHPAYFKVFDARGKDVPVRLIQLKNNVDNLFQMPTLFLVGGALATVYGPDSFCIFLGWLYVGLRATHSFIHLTYNHVIHRFAAFVLSNICILLIWIRVAFVLAP